jgi:hypothetical protein
METIPYRNTKLLVKTIPKNTLLFRLVKRPEDDLRGVLLEDGTRCLTPNYNVYFYPDPFTGKLALQKWDDLKEIPEMQVYLLNRDVKVLDLVNDPKYSRSTKNSKVMFVKRCSTVKQGCLTRKPTHYDPCVSKTIIEKFPDIVGLYVISAGDSRALKRTIKNSKYQRYIHFQKDSRNFTGVPEIILHPLVKRPSKDVITQETDKLENNYKLLESVPLQDDMLLRFMKQHAMYDSAIGFYKYH